MTSEFWGMTAFLATTLVFLGTTLFYRLKLDRVQRQLDQLQQKSPQSEYHDNEQRKPKQE